MGKNRGITRREFCKLAAMAAAGAVIGTSLKPFQRFFPETPQINGFIVGPAFTSGHLLRQGKFPEPSRSIKTELVIVGAGVSGLSAGWNLNRMGFRDFLILELENQIGGNSRFGENKVTSFPWAAHYIAAPDKIFKELCLFMEEAGIITGYDTNGEPEFMERYLCFAPQERLFIHGRWQEDLFPFSGALPHDIRQYEEFKSIMIEFKNKKGRDGKKAFSIPLEESSRDQELIKLDNISMAQFMEMNGWNSDRLRWYVEYACRDDFGTSLETTSAWAGIHYWASRGSSFTKEEDVVLTWPEGNGFLVKKLSENIKSNLIKGAMVYNVSEERNGVRILYFDIEKKKSISVQTDKVILACP